MNANALRLARAGLLAGPIILLASCATSPQQDAGAVLARASGNGSNSQRLQYAGIFFTIDQGDQVVQICVGR